MTNSEITKIIDLTSKLIVLHDDKSLQTPLYDNTFKSLRRWSTELIDMDENAIKNIGGLDVKGSQKVIEIIKTGTLQEYQEFMSKTPIGLVELLGMKGLGAKTLRKLWVNLDIKSAEELLKACRKDELLKLKGFGAKSQEGLKQRLIFLLSMRGFELFATVEKKANALINTLKKEFPTNDFFITGELRRKEQIIKKIDLLHNVPDISISKSVSNKDNKYYFKETEIKFHYADNASFGSQLLATTGPSKFIKSIGELSSFDNEELFFKIRNINFIPAEIRHYSNVLEEAKNNDFSDLITVPDLKGVLHMHTTASDGLNSLEEMISHAENIGYEYMLITDHSKSAGYANGLQIQRLIQQIDQIKSLNNQYKINVYSGIESDVLSDGSLDYPEDILAQLDVVIASVHSGLSMDIAKATDRIIKAIHNPYTRIMGHLTARLLTVREGYPVDHHKILDACADTNTSMELNANPSRLDMDEKYIKYAMEKGVKISINPDAHSISQLNLMQYGVNAARRGGLTKDFCLNAMDKDQFDQWVHNK